MTSISKKSSTLPTRGMLFAAVRKSVIGQCGQWLGMAFARIVVRDHTDGGTGETRMGMEDGAATLFGPSSIALAQ